MKPCDIEDQGVDCHVDPTSKTITKLVFKRRTPMVEIWLEDQPALTCHLDLILGYQLETGMTLEPKVIEALRVDQRALEAWQKVLRYCHSRTRTVAEVRRFLSAAEVPEELAEDFMERLRRDYSLDDHRAASEFDEQNRERLGDRRIRSELRRRGISGGVIESVMGSRSGLDRETEEFETALALAKKKVDSDRGVDPRKVAMRVAGLLQRKGYSQSVIRKVAQSLDLKLF